MKRSIKDLKTISSILAALSISPSAFGGDVFVRDGGKLIPFDQTKSRLMPKQELVIKIEGVQYNVTHSDMMDILNKVKSGSKNRSIGIKIHEETKLIDFGTFDDLVIRLPIGDVNKSVPNVETKEK